MSARLVFFSQINPFCLSLTCCVPFTRSVHSAARHARAEGASGRAVLRERYAGSKRGKGSAL